MDFDIDQRDRYGRSALMWAAEMNHKDAVETLIDLGSDRKLVEPQSGRYSPQTADPSTHLPLGVVLLMSVTNHVAFELKRSRPVSARQCP